MVVGIDIGGTNTDAAIVNEEITTIKLPNEAGIGEVLKRLSGVADLGKEKLIVSTSLPLNLILSRYHEIPTLVLLIPGPGLNYSSYGSVLRGFTSHRGDVVEDIDEAEVRKVIEESRVENVAIAGKFSVRNPELEKKVYRIALNRYNEDCIALSYPIGELNFPLRVNTAVVNAKIKKTVTDLAKLVGKYSKEFFFYKGDGGIIPVDIAIQNPSLLYNSSPAAVAIGASYLTGEKNAIVVDIGGTTTDFVVIEDGKPKIMEKVEIAGRKTLIRCVDSISIPFGGDSVVDSFLRPVRMGSSFAFHGSHFTLTDALNCVGFDIGDSKASRSACKSRDIAEKAIEDYLSIVAETIREIGAEKIIGTGFLAKYLAPEIAKKAGVKYVVPEHSEAANAIGVAVSRISLTLYARFDTERRRAVFNGEVVKFQAAYDDERLVEVAKEKVREIAIAHGANEEDVEDVRLVYFNSYTVVRGGVRRGMIADVVVQIEPGISSEFR
ncbi:hydantoinase/oxoprolinase family protein [Archaeoglobus veneficus]|uniref:Hydantoinase/oxoprolinase n=1 Tax=Archaeoglobus veneficus (strain DSM 11195 / SNP6) TaxID=693661 RepID=F2KQG9_ARCVS|nr:hydantoinase/oxoprolinase family protein [Archaeoglobus veneficus]AEA47702.1 Hydantoinase/oxoprolinase [Archaeoglobus veneficus SNP6]